MAQRVAAMWAYVVGQWQPAVSGLRDAQMADNLLWLLEEAFPGRRIIVWAATLHVARAVEEIEWMDSGFMYEGYTTVVSRRLCRRGNREIEEEPLGERAGGVGRRA